MSSLLEVALVLVPAGVANSVPVVAARYNWVPALARPLDGGLNVIGQNKTVRGFVVGILFASITGYFQYFLIGREPFSTPLFSIVFGGLLGLGALAGDALASFIKRRAHIAPGAPWRPFDQIDAAIGALVVAWPFVSLSVIDVVIAVTVFGMLSAGTSIVGFWLRIKKTI